MGPIIEIAVAALLIGTCGYCFVLSRKLQAIRESQEELVRIIHTFDAASRRAQENLSLMQGEGASMREEIVTVSSRANALIDELSVMVHAGDRIAGRLEGAVQDVRQLGRRKNIQAAVS
ncbi:MAG: DUF6468 domain-containing protein [Pseudomonadota bacterium]